jgi:UDP-glucose 4-epimerase
MPGRAHRRLGTGEPHVKVVVTGGAGFIGSNLGRELLARPDVDEVVALDDLSTGDRANLDGTGIRLLEGTILDPAALDAACDGAQAIIHLAALPSVPRSVLDPVASHHANATGTLQVLEAARRAGDLHVVVASSSSVYGANRELPKRESMRTAPISPYAVSKQATEAYAMSFGHTYGLPTLAFRFFNVYGPLQPAGHAYAAVVPAFVDAALRGVPITIHGDGEQTRDFTNVGTVTRVLADAVARTGTDQEPVNLAFGSRTSLNALVDQLADILGFAPQVEHVEPRAGDVRDSQADNARLRHHFPDVEPVALREGLQQTVDWFRTLPDHRA